jgi:hypothetical protein
MWALLRLLLTLACLAYGVFCLLLGYRRIGKPEGADPKYDAWYRQWSGSYKLLGWGWIVLLMLGPIGSLLGLIGFAVILLL